MKQNKIIIELKARPNKLDPLKTPNINLQTRTVVTAAEYEPQPSGSTAGDKLNKLQKICKLDIMTTKHQYSH